MVHAWHKNDNPTVIRFVMHTRRYSYVLSLGGITWHTDDRPIAYSIRLIRILVWRVRFVYLTLSVLCIEKKSGGICVSMPDTYSALMRSGSIICRLRYQFRLRVKNSARKINCRKGYYLTEISLRAPQEKQDSNFNSPRWFRRYFARTRPKESSGVILSKEIYAITPAWHIAQKFPRRPLHLQLHRIFLGSTSPAILCCVRAAAVKCFASRTCWADFFFRWNSRKQELKSEPLNHCKLGHN